MGVDNVDASDFSEQNQELDQWQLQICAVMALLKMESNATQPEMIQLAVMPKPASSSLVRFASKFDDNSDIDSVHRLTHSIFASDYNSRCCLNCQLRPSSYECRPSISNCDIAEYCTGNSSSCPEDKHVDDGSSCGTDLQCASGQCTSRDQQCKQRGGSAMNVSGSCSLDSSNCQLSCASPMGGIGSCLLFTGNFIDGTPCGVGGSCVNGSCSTAAFGKNDQDKK
jgi:hypothetical protein